VRPNDRVRTVDRVDGPTGTLIVDFAYESSPAAGEVLELHHLHPDLQLRADVLAGLRRCFFLENLDLPAVDPLPDPMPAGAVTVDLTAQAFWLTAARQVLAVAADGSAVPEVERYGRTGPEGWSVYANRGHLHLVLPPGVGQAAMRGDQVVTVRAYRDAWGSVDGVDVPAGFPAGQAGDALAVAVPVEYAAAFGHIEGWRRHRDRLEASAAEGRFANQEEAAAEASRCAATFADWLFRPQTERGDRVASPWGAYSKQSRYGLGGHGLLAAAQVNQNDPYGPIVP
jgi:hypothetical protein